MAKEERSSRRFADLEFLSVVRIAVNIAVSVPADRPGTVVCSEVALTRPAAVVQFCRHAVSWRSDCKKISYKGFVPADETVVDYPFLVRRPVPVEIVAVRGLAVPVPLCFFPDSADAFPDGPFVIVVAVKELQGCNQTLVHKCSLDEISSVVLFAEPGYGLSCLAVHKVRIHTVMALSLA